MLETRADLLKYAIANALAEACKVVRGLRKTLTVTEREAVGEEAARLVQSLPDDPWKLAEPLPKRLGLAEDLGASTPPDWCKIK
ncbi:MAG TPA: hypothetical protein VH206_17280 [Xanthobacteraceae bacterium]|jgi:hypothetical protein|nr:hypothetical protein [Xanthobacteraceae bacterium]